jgi:hypothetical protein
MSILANVKYYLNYLYFNREDTKIRDYFTSNEYYRAIKELAEEGYLAMFLKFQSLAKIYSSIYPINTEESLFISQVENNYIINNIHQNYDRYLTIIKLTENFIESYRESSIGSEKEFRINFMNYELYKKDLLNTLQIFEAVIMRRFINKILEKLIIKNIDIIQIKDYIPSPTILNNYQESLNSHYIFRKGKEKDTKEANIDSYINIEDKLKEEIKLSENHYEMTKNDKTKIYPKILYVKENDITKILKILFRMETACNEIFYLVKETAKEKVNVNDYIFNNFRIDIESGKDLGSENRIILNDSKMNTVVEHIKISIKKVAVFIAYGNPTYE